jgi:hypothetical protein
MASEQARREDTTSEREFSVERERVPKIANHFVSLIEKPKESVVLVGVMENLSTEGGNEMGAQFESLADKVRAGTDVSSDKERERWEEEQERKAREGYSVGKFEVKGEGERGGRKEKNGEQNNEQELSLDEITKLRGTAQQNSLEALKAAEER